MEFNNDFKKQLIKQAPEAVDAFFDAIGDKAYSYAYLFFSNRLIAEQAVRESFAVFLNKTAMLLKNASVLAAYFAVLKAWCDKKATEDKKEGKETLYDISGFNKKNQISEALVNVLSQLNKKERSLFIFADVISLPRSVICEIYDAEEEDLSTAVFLLREKVRDSLNEIGDFSVNGGDDK